MKKTNLIGKVAVLGLSAACCFAVAGCSAGGYAYTGGVAATVNGTEIEEDTITKYVEDYRTSAGYDTDDAWGTWLNESSMDAATVREQVIDYYVEIELVNQACTEKEITVDSSEVDSAIETMKANYDSDEAWQEALSTAGLTEDQYRESVEQGLKEQALEDAVAGDTEAKDADVLEMLTTYGSYFDGAKRSSQILFSADDEDTAKKVLKQINSGKLSFEDAVEQYSTDSVSKESKGDVGWDITNSFVDEYTEGLDGLEKGEVSDLVTSDYGIHIIKCTDVFSYSENDTALTDFPDGIVDYVRDICDDDAKTSAYDDWFTDYKDQAEIVINDMPENVPYNIDVTQYASSDDESDDDSSDEDSDDDSSDDEEIELSDDDIEVEEVEE